MKNKYLFLLLALLSISIQAKAQMPPCTECAYGEAECEFSESIALAPVCTLSTPTYTTLHGFVPSQSYEAGTHSIKLQQQQLLPGMYFLHLLSAKEQVIEKVMIIR